MAAAAANLEHLPELASAKGSVKRLVKPGVRGEEFFREVGTPRPGCSRPQQPCLSAFAPLLVVRVQRASR
jgi:hypothetical protein